MKRVWSALPAFFGVACIMAAIATAFFLVPQLRVVPLDLDITSDAQTVAADGTTNNRFPAVIFDRCSVTQRKARQLDANLVQQRRSVIVDPSDKRQATIQSAQSVIVERTRDADGKETTPTAAAANAERTCNDGLLTATIDRVSVNRKTSVPNGTIASIQLESVPEGASVKDVSVDAPRQGFQYKFGFNVKKRDYVYFDLNTRTDNAAKFVGEKVINGVTAYEFVSEVPETDLSSLANAQGEAALGTMLTMPASWWGITGRDIKPNDSVTLHRYAKATRRVFVEPKTGTIVDGREDQHQYFMSPDQSEDTPASVRNYRLDALKGTFQWDDATVARQTDKAAGYLNQLKWGGVFVPIILAVVGVLLLGLWLLLFLRGRNKDNDPSGDDGYDDDGNGGNGDEYDRPLGGPGPSAAAGFTPGGISLDKGDDRPTTVLPYNYGNPGYSTSVTESGRHQRIEDAGWAPLSDQTAPSGPYRADPYGSNPYADNASSGSQPWARQPQQPRQPFSDQDAADQETTQVFGSATDQETTQVYGSPTYTDQSYPDQSFGDQSFGTDAADDEQPSNVAPTNRHERPDSDNTTVIQPDDDYQGRHSGSGTAASTFFTQSDDDDDVPGPAVRRHVDPEDR